MKNILVVNVNWLGDVVFSTPVFKALKKRYPQARVSCLAVPRVQEILERCPHVDDVLIYDDKKAHLSPLGKLQLILNLRAKKFDAAFLLHRSMTRALLVYLAGIPVRVGFKTSKQNGFLTHRVFLDGKPLHRSDEYLKVIEWFGVPVNDRHCELTVAEATMVKVQERLAGFGIEKGEPFIIINPGGNWDLKRWSAASFSALIETLVKDLGWKVIISGGPGDVALAERIARDSQVDPIVWAGQTSLSELLALYKTARLVISNDSGPSHMASSVGTDVIVLFGPTRPEITAPRGTGRVSVLFREIGCNKAPCYHLSCSSNDCMKTITVQDVCEVIRQRSR